MKRALITGITGQDGSYLAELLLAKGYEVHGLVRRTSLPSRDRIDPLLGGAVGDQVHLHLGDLTEGTGVFQIVREIEPDEIYNLGAQSHVRVSFEMPEYTADTNAVGTLRLLEAIRTLGLDCRLFQASTSEMFGATPPPHNEGTNFRPCSPYGAAKLFSHWLTVNHREAYGTFAVSGIMFNHESPRRGRNFVTRKITQAVARIHAGLDDQLTLGNLDVARDWGYAPEYVEAMWRMLQQDEPTDFVLATGRSTTLREFCSTAFGHVGLDWRDYVRHDEGLLRPTEIEAPVGDASKAKALLDWKPQVLAPALARLMVDADVEALSA
jgi:GDPmannose 4,6-dehydratase